MKRFQLAPIAVTIFVMLISQIGLSQSMGPARVGGGLALKCEGVYYFLDFIHTISADAENNYYANLYFKPENLKKQGRFNQLRELEQERSVLRAISGRLLELAKTSGGDSKLLGDLGFSLQRFSALNASSNSAGEAKYLWTLTPQGFPPSATGDAVDSRSPKICDPGNVQAIRRDSREGGIVTFDADLKVLNDLRETSSLQLTFAFIHEWLRGYIRDSRDIAPLTRYLHSEDFFQADAKSVIGYLKGFGVSMEGASAPVPNHMVGATGDSYKSATLDLSVVRSLLKGLNGCKLEFRIEKDDATRKAETRGMEGIVATLKAGVEYEKMWITDRPYDDWDAYSEYLSNVNSLARVVRELRALRESVEDVSKNKDMEKDQKEGELAHLRGEIARLASDEVVLKRLVGPHKSAFEAALKSQVEKLRKLVGVEMEEGSTYDDLTRKIYEVANRKGCFEDPKAKK